MERNFYQQDQVVKFAKILLVKISGYTVLINFCQLNIMLVTKVLSFTRLCIQHQPCTTQITKNKRGLTAESFMFSSRSDYWMVTMGAADISQSRVGRCICRLDIQ